MSSPSLHDALVKRESEVILQTYRRQPIVIDRAEGCRIYDVDGRSYLDMIGGIAVMALGHSHPSIFAAVTEQMQKYMHVSNSLYQEPQIKLAEALTAATGYPRLFYCNSGTEATEGAIKLAHKYGSEHRKYDVIGFSGGFHGRTYAALSIMDKPLYKDGMGPFLPNTLVLPYNDIDALEARINEDTCAVMLEFIQGEGGLAEASQEFIDALYALKKRFGFLVIADEVQTGYGRTGSFFAFERYGIKPDIVTIAKAMGGGLPLGGFLVSAELSAMWNKGMHGSTYGGNPVACAAGLVVLDEVVGGLMQHVREIGAYALSKFEALASTYPNIIREARGRGCMLGLALHREAQPLIDRLTQQGVIANVAGGTVMRFVPPLIINTSDIDELVEALHAVFSTTD